MNDADRQLLLQLITKKLVIFTLGIVIAVIVITYALSATEEGQQTPILALAVFTCGLLGGFVSIQQRLPKISIEEMRTLTKSWLSITLIPINGGIFAIVLMLMFMGGIIEGVLFPGYPDIKIDSTGDFYTWVNNTYPTSGKEIAKLLFWSFVAGFSERFVPQVIRKVTDQVQIGNSDKKPQ